MPSQFVLDSGVLDTDLLGPVVIATASADLGSLGSSEHLEAQDHFQRLVVAPIQTEIKAVFEKLLALRDGGAPTEIEIKQFQMVSLPDTKPIETVNVNKTEGIDENKNETITE